MENQSAKSINSFADFYDHLSEPDCQLPEWNMSNYQQKCLILLYWFTIILPVLIVMIFIPTIYVIYIIFYVVPQIGNRDDSPELYFWHTRSEHNSAKWKAWILFISFTILAILLLISFIKAIFTQPGQIPDSQEWQLNDSDSNSDEEEKVDQVEKRKDGMARICYSCSKYKPDRAHHCRVCQRCHVKMDHHCPWIANCVGYYNYKFFFLAVGYGALALTIFTASFWESVIVFLNDDDTSIGVSFTVLMLYSLAALLNIAVIGFWTFHWYLILWGFSTLEFCEKRTKAYLYKEGSPYDLGCLKNIKSALGNQWQYWFLPFGTYREPGDLGLYFESKSRNFYQSEGDEAKDRE